MANQKEATVTRKPALSLGLSCKAGAQLILVEVGQKQVAFGIQILSRLLLNNQSNETRDCLIETT